VPQVIEEREQIRAQARYVRSSARKARLVLEHIRGKSAVEAQAILAFQTRAVARDAGKVLKSAIANAEMNNGHDVDELIVLTAYADEGPTLKRWRARARGRVNRIRKRTCHITITLSPALPGEIKAKPERRAPEPEPAAEEKPKRRSRSRKAAAETPATEAAAEATAEEVAAGEADAEDQVADEPAVEADSPDAAPAEPEAVEEPEAADEPEAAEEPAAEEEPAEEEQPAAEEPEADAPDAEAGAGESTDEENKEADS
jgi:large subunit ribosomal protein L22